MSIRSDIHDYNGNEEQDLFLPSEEAFPVMSSVSIRSRSTGASSRDEMNLAEFPITVLSTRADPKIKTLEFQDSVKLKSGKLLRREWIITGADKFGLPTATDDEVLLGLLKLTVDDGIKSQKVYFTRYELLRILKWSTEGRSYSRLQNALDRLSGVRVKATNAFFDNEAKSHRTKNFGIIDAYEINDGRDSGHKPSFFIWSEELFNSFQVGFIKKFDLDFYLDLKSSISKRLYRYLDKLFWYKTRHTFNLFTLAHEKIGISRNYKYASSIKQQLDPALQELIEQNFISGVEYQGRGRNTEIILSAAQKKPRSQGAISKSEEKTVEEESELSAEMDPLLADLIERGILKPQAERLIANLTADQKKRVPQIIAYVDSLVQSDSKLITKSPTGFLYSAIQKGDSFVLPGEREEQYEKKKPEKKPEHTFKSRSASIAESRKLEAEFLVDRRMELEKKEQGLEPRIVEKLRAEVEQSLRNMKNLLDEKNYQKVLSAAFEERLAAFLCLADFDEWLKERNRK